MSSGERALSTRGPTALAPHDVSSSVRDARATLALARQRVMDRLDAVEAALRPVVTAVEGVGQAFQATAPVRQRVKDAVRRHPALALGGALLVGYGLARLFFRR